MTEPTKEPSDLPALRLERDAARLRVRFSGAWITRQLTAAEAALGQLGAPGTKEVLLDFAAITQLDSAGALLLQRAQRGLVAAGLKVELDSLGAGRQRLWDAVTSSDKPLPPPPKSLPALLALFDHLGRAVFEILRNGRNLLGFLGLTLAVLARSLLRPWTLRGKAIAAHAETSGVYALPIIGLISFLIGIVLAYQGAEQLARFGAQIFTVNIVGIGVLREMAILLAAIIVAGRSGSAYTAQIGAMQVNEEIDALRVLGLDPMEILVMPRLIALTLVMPLIAFYAGMMGLFGGAIMCWVVLDISLPSFVSQLREAVDQWDFFVGFIKAPIFGFLIATVGCYQGFQVERSAESVGNATTRSVVQGVFLVIVLDGLLSIFFQIIGV